MTILPTKITRPSPAEIEIAWSDGQSRVYRVAELRDKCPCATCREKRNAPPPPANVLPVISHAETIPAAIVGMKPVGHYAYSIEFQDGHDTGIFTFDLLRELGEVRPSA